MYFIQCRATSSHHTDILLALSSVKIIEESINQKDYLKLTDSDGKTFTCRKDPDTRYGISESLVQIGE